MTIPSKPSDSSIRRYARNIIDVYNRATQDQVSRGRDWYPEAHRLATQLSDDVRKGAGVIAALSARNSWERNVTIATASFATGTPSGHTRANLAKAARIMSGESPETVLPMTLKTGHFYRSIVAAGETDAVTIDRHAHDVAVGRKYGDKEDRGLSSQSRYDALVKAYRIAARRTGHHAATLQAIVWTVWVDETQYQRVG